MSIWRAKLETASEGVSNSLATGLVTPGSKILPMMHRKTVTMNMSTIVHPFIVEFHGRSPSSARKKEGVNLLGPSCTPARGSYLICPRRDSGVSLVDLASEARDRVGRRLKLSRYWISDTHTKTVNSISVAHNTSHLVPLDP